MLPSLALPRSGSRGRYTVQRSASSQPRPQLPQHLRIDTKLCYAARLRLSTLANNWRVGQFENGSCLFRGSSEGWCSRSAGWKPSLLKEERDARHNIVICSGRAIALSSCRTRSGIQSFDFALLRSGRTGGWIPAPGFTGVTCLHGNDGRLHSIAMCASPANTPHR